MSSNLSTTMNNCTAGIFDSPNAEQLGVGSFYIVVSLPLLLVYIPTVICLRRDEDLMALPVFKILLWDSLCDLLQVVGVGFCAGVYSITNNVCNRSLNLLIGSLIGITWSTGSLLDLTVALNRLLAVTCEPAMNKLFGGRKCYGWIVGAFLYGLALNAVYLGRGGGVIYDLSCYAWYYADDGDSMIINSTIELAQDYIVQSLMFIFCVATIYQLIKKRKSTSQVHLNTDEHLNIWHLNKEKNAIYQVFIICFLLMALSATYLILPTFVGNKWAMFAGNTLWVLVSGSFPFIVLKFNFTVRETVIAALKKVVQSNKVFTLTKSHTKTVKVANIGPGKANDEEI